MQISAKNLLPGKHSSYYLFGEDRDALLEAAEALMAEGEQDTVRLRVDVSELDKIEVESRSQGLFGPQACYAIVRNAESATPKQSDHLLALASSVQPENRLIVCAPEITWKKAIHKKLLDAQDVVSIEFRIPSLESFQQWLAEQVKQENLYVDHDALEMIGERLNGLRAVAQQLIVRMKLYDNEEGIRFGKALVGELLGERAPDDLDTYCHAVAMKESQSVQLLRHLLINQQVSDVQLLTWLSMRMNNLLMFKWYQGKGERNPIMAARIFGAGKQLIPKEAKLWSAAELIAVTKKITEAEKLLKGASVESRPMVLERLTLEMVSNE